MYEDLKQHMNDFFRKGIRFDGRKFDEYRNITIETGISKSAEGSARVRIGETEVMVGVKFELGKPYPDSPDEGTIMVGAELLPMSNPEFEPGPPSIQAVELARVVDRGIRESKVIDFQKLCVKEGEQCWVVTIDIMTINVDGNLFDAGALASIIALKEARIPKIDNETTVNYKELTKEKLPLSKKDPVSVTVCKIGNTYIVDPTAEEEKVVDARLTVATTNEGKICAMQKGGVAPLSLADIEAMTALASKKCNELRTYIK
jgi:exosome complex component RRP42